MSLWKLLGFGSVPDSDDIDASGSESDAIHRIATALGRLPGDRARYLAGFAYLLGRVAHADQHASAEETQEMERVLRDHGLEGDEPGLVVEMAQSQALLFEDNEIRRISSELRLTHADFISVRRAYRTQLGVLKPADGSSSD